MADANTRANPNSGKRILLVEDERELRELLAIGLRRAGYTVDTAANAGEARQLIEAQSYALVIADRQLPDGNGIDLGDQALKRRARTLVISGYSFGLPAGAARRHSVVMNRSGLRSRSCGTESDRKSQRATVEVEQ